MSLKRNIPLLYVIGALMWGRFFIPVLALFYIASQVPIEQFAIIMAVFALSTLLLEVPSGVVADLLGKKKTLLLSRFMYVIEICLVAFFNGFAAFLVAKMFSGLGVSLSSGTNQALLYDTLKKLGREKEHKKISGLMATITNVFGAFVFIIGAFLFSVHYKLPAYATLPCITIGFILTFFLKEPYTTQKKMTFSNSWKHLKEGIAYVKKSNFIKYLIFFSVPLAAGASIGFSMSSAYFELIAIPIFLIGAVSFISSLLMAYTSKIAYKLEEKLGQEGSLLLMEIMIFASIFCMSFMIKYVGLLFYYFIPLAAGFSQVVLNHYMNKNIPTSHRATLLSIRNMGDNIGAVMLFPIVGYITKLISMQLAFLILAGIILVYMVILRIASPQSNKAYK